MQLGARLYYMAANVPNPKQQACINYYLGEAQGNATKAATMAGYKKPRVSGSLIIRRYKHLVEAAQAKASEASTITLEGTLQKVANLCNNDSHKDHVVGLRLALQVLGALGDKVVADPKALREQLEQALKPVDLPQPKAKPTSKQSNLSLVLTQTA